MKIAIILNGADFNSQHFEENYQEDDFIIAADGGITITNKYGIKTDLFVGDQDSSSPQESKQATNTIILEKEKDYSDFHICLQYIVDNMPQSKIMIYNGTGGRVDHFIAIYETCIYFSKWLDLEIISSSERIMFKKSSFTIKNNKDKTVSIFSGLDEIENLSLKGFRYTLENYNLKRIFPLSLSNIITSDEARISFSQGVVVMFINFKN